MTDEQTFEIKICHNGVHFAVSLRGKEHYRQVKSFLNDLVAPQFGCANSPRPIPDPTMDYYELDDAQLEAYSAFQRNLGTPRI